MPTRIDSPTRIVAAGHPPKRIDEHVGRVNTGDAAVSVAHMRSPPGWQEPGQRPEFREITIILSGAMQLEHHDAAGNVVTMVIVAGQSVITEPGEWIRYGTPDGCEYIAVCLPAFSPETVHRDPA